MGGGMGRGTGGRDRVRDGGEERVEGMGGKGQKEGEGMYWSKRKVMS
jgi:hypothetical protein